MGVETRQMNYTTDQLNTLLGYIPGTKAKADYITPAVTGTTGQVLTIGTNGPEWQTPGAGGVEDVTLQLSVSGGTGSVVGVEVIVKVEGGATSGFTTDNTGKCQFSVEGGAIYNIITPEIAGYATPEPLSFRSTLASRTVNVVYIAKALTEQVLLTLVYDLTSSARATTVNVTDNGTTTTKNIVNDQCVFDVTLGHVYTLTFSPATAFITPSPKTFTASTEQRFVKAYYIAAVSGLTWIKNDGSTIGLYDVTGEDKPNLLGLHIAPTSLQDAESTYIVPMAYLLGESTLGSMNWGSSVEFTSIGMYTSESAALTNDGHNFDGEGNTIAVLGEATRRQLSTAAFTACHNLTYTVAGEVKNCFLGSYAQMKAFSTNREVINGICLSAFGRGCIAINSGIWWCSTQCSADKAVILGGGGFNSNHKYYDYSVVPFLAY